MKEQYNKFTLMQTEQSQETKTSTCPNWSSFSSERIPSVWRKNPLKLKRGLTDLPAWGKFLWQVFTIQTTQAWSDLVLLPPQPYIYYPKIRVFEVSLPFFCTELHCSRSSARISRLIDFSEIFKTKSRVKQVQCSGLIFDPWSSTLLGPLITQTQMSECS